eukprot:m.355265 g.355265  ORF g.355265 m.355265 type:complete len:956 (+) comp20735_c1_seq2:219-3086(+)
MLWHVIICLILVWRTGTVISTSAICSRSNISCTLSDTTNSISDTQFEDFENLISISIPNSVTKIGNRAFKGCTSLTSVSIPYSVRNIGFQAFAQCNALQNVTLNTNSTIVSNDTFPSCIGYGLNISDDASDDGHQLGHMYTTFQCIPCPGHGTNLTISDLVTSIGANAFNGCSDFEYATLPNSVVKLGDRAFKNCQQLRSVELPTALKRIGEATFYGCSRLHHIRIPSSVTYIGDQAFMQCGSLKYVTITTSVNVLRSTFSSCLGIGLSDVHQNPLQTSLTLQPKTYFCMTCNGLDDLSISSGVTVIGSNAFAACTDIRTVRMANTVTTIKESAFQGCSNLNSVSIPDSVTNIESSAFQFCESLTEVIVPTSVSDVSVSAFYGCALCYEFNIIAEDDAPSEIHSHLAFGGKYTVITSYTFYHCDLLTKVTLSDFVSVIQNRAISFASQLHSIDIPDSVTTIEKSAFEGCVNLDSVNIPPHVRVNTFAFFACHCRLVMYTNGAAVQHCKQGFLSGPKKEWQPYPTCNNSTQYTSRQGGYTTDKECKNLTTCTHSQSQVVARTPTTDRRCEETASIGMSPTSKIAIGVAIPIVILCLGATIVYMHQKRKRTESDLHIRELLLQDERAERASLYAENIEMKRAWEISEEDLLIKEQVAAGAFGTVWHATWGHVEVAVKMLKNVVDSMASDDFSHEVSFMQKIRHPNLVLFYGAGVTTTQVPFLVVEFMRNGSMRKVLQSERELPCGTRLSMASDIALGMRHLHAIGSIHRDLKSDNCLVGENLRIKVADFGTSRLVKGGDNHMHTGMTTSVFSGEECNGHAEARATHNVGTPLWMAPEMMRRGGAYGQEVDVYSYGIVLWELLTRCIPWEKDISETGPFFSAALWDAVQGGQRPTIPTTSELPSTYVHLMTQCWDGEPKSRPSFVVIVQTMSECIELSKRQNRMEIGSEGSIYHPLAS